MNDIDKLIYALSRDILGKRENREGQMEDCIATHSEPERRLLALLITYSLGEELVDKIVGDANNP